MNNWKDTYLAARALHNIILENRPKTLEELTFLVESEPDAKTLLGELKEGPENIGTIKDLLSSLDWLLFLNDETWRSEENKLHHKRPIFYPEPDAIVVTDTDFFPMEGIASYDDFRVAYGVIAYSEIYQVHIAIIHSLRRIKSVINKKISLKAWKELVDIILNRLLIIKERYNMEMVRVRVPHYFYDDDIVRTIARYKRVKLILETLETESVFDDDSVEGESKQEKIPWPYMAFQQYAILMDEKHCPGLEYVREEMIRIGLMSPVSTLPRSNGYRIHILGDKRASSFIEDGTTEKLDGELINRVGVLYCMLYGLVEDKSLLTKVAHFALNDNKPFKGRPSSNTEYTYIAHPLERMFDKLEKEEFVEAKLIEYGFPEDTLKRIENELRQEKGQK